MKLPFSIYPFRLPLKWSLCALCSPPNPISPVNTSDKGSKMLSKCLFFLLWVCPFIQEMLPPFLRCLLSFTTEELTSPSRFKQTSLLSLCRVDFVLYCYTQILKINQWIKWQNINSCLQLQTVETRTRDRMFFSLRCSSVNQTAIEQFRVL